MPVGEKYIKEKFEQLDKDSSGELDQDEVEDMLRQVSHVKLGRKCDMRGGCGS